MGDARPLDCSRIEHAGQRHRRRVQPPARSSCGRGFGVDGDFDVVCSECEREWEARERERERERERPERDRERDDVYMSVSLTMNVQAVSTQFAGSI
jgi:hypothetical protein